MLDEHGRLRLSPSKLMNWKNCPRLFQGTMAGEKSHSISSCVGTAAHYVMEQINNGIIMTSDQRDSLMEAKLVEECRAKGIGIAFNKAFELSAETVRKYEIPKDRIFINAEAKRELEFDNFVFVYIIDAEFTNLADDVLFIRDYKTSYKVPSTPLQLLLYTWAEIERFKRKGVIISADQVRGEFHMLRNDKVHEYQMSAKEIHEVDRWVHEQVAIIHELNRLNTSDDPRWRGQAFPEIPGAGCFFCPRLDCTSRI